jgi:hypothetical protein
MKFQVVGASNGMAASPIVERVTRFLRGQPDGKLFTGPALSAAMKINFVYFRTFRAYLPASLSVRVKSAKIYANPKTIAAWKEAHQVPD